MGCSLSGSSVHGDPPGKNTGVGCHTLLQENLPNPGIKPRSPAIQVGSLLSEPPGKHTGENSGALLQGNVPDPGLQHGSLTSPALAGEFFTASAIWEAQMPQLESKNLSLNLAVPHFQIRVAWGTTI